MRSILYCVVLVILYQITPLNSFVNDFEENFYNELEAERNLKQLNNGRDIEIVHLTRKDHPSYDFDAFGTNIKLNLKPNDKIVSDSFKSFIRDDLQNKEIIDDIRSCYFLHRDSQKTAAVNFCDNNNMHGYIFFEKYVLEITPTHKELSDKNKTFVPHVVKRNYIQNQSWTFDSGFSNRTSLEGQIKTAFNKENVMTEKSYSSSNPIVEAALFFDEAAYQIFAPYFKHDTVKIRDMLLAYMNGVQALYHHPSTGKPIDITLTRLEIFKKQPYDLPGYNGEREALLDSFCDYNVKHNPEGDDNPEHWDIGLYVSGLDFYAIEKGKRSGVTMGLAVVGGICQTKYACVIAEFGVTNIFGKPYPSAGFTSVFVLAHEIGHSLGMHHDGYSNDCPNDGFIMSPSRGAYGETLWSKCSAQVLTSLDTWATCLYDQPNILNELDHRKFEDTPGVIWTLKKQCEVFLKDEIAEAIIDGNEEEVCKSVKCKTPHRAGFYFAGPAIEGSLCAPGKWCQGGECVAKSNKEQNSIIEGGWSEWNYHPCNSGCIVNSIGYSSRQRTCDNPPPKNTNKGCDGLSYEVHTCSDNKICRNRRKTVEEYASSRCKEFSKYISDIDSLGGGLQAPHEYERPWMGCAIFCRRSDGSSYYTPRIELNDAGLDPYFPDGTWCHNDGKDDYFCLQHHCLPENFNFNKNLFWKEDIPLLQNAPPHINPLPDNLLRYLSTDLKGNPLLKTLNPNFNIVVPEGAWANKDYIDLPYEYQT